MSVRRTLAALCTAALTLVAVPAAAAAPVGRVGADDPVGDVRGAGLTSDQRELADIERVEFRAGSGRIRAEFHLGDVRPASDTEVLEASFSAVMTLGGLVSVILHVSARPGEEPYMWYQASGGEDVFSCPGAVYRARPRLDKVAFTMPLRCFRGIPRLYEPTASTRLEVQDTGTTLVGRDRSSVRAALRLR